MRVVTVTQSVLEKMGIGEEGLQTELERRISSIVEEKRDVIADAYDEDLEGLRQG